ncbi:MAG TPA: deoxyribodipyrimidine photolyase [Terriglobia bacterium]|nr:deoxyribodipyrimidine photolyase [Terriglobia bacterium]
MERVTPCNARPVDGAGDYVLYWMTAYRRRHFNFALERAVFWATELRKPLVIFEALSSTYRWASVRFHEFVIDGMRENCLAFQGSPVTYLPYVEPSAGEGRRRFATLLSAACLVITDDFPASGIPAWIEKAAVQSTVLVEKVDSNGLYPMRATDRVFLTAASFRRFLQQQGPPHFPAHDALERLDLPRGPERLLKFDPLNVPPSIDSHVGKVPETPGGTTAARERLKRFVAGSSARSRLSPYLHFGHISAHEVYQQVQATRRENKEHFFDELVTWRELGFNMCALRQDYDQYASLPLWARNTLAKHESDPRPFLYSLDALENAETHDLLWNSAQTQLVTQGQIENRLRMLWGKKILEWSRTPQEALNALIHLNNKYALDGRDPNSYTGIFWTLGRYDRPWGPERPIFGLVRYMSSASTAKKLKIKV